MIEYLVCTKFDEFFLFETEQITSYDLIYNDDSKRDLINIAKEFFLYLNEIDSTENEIDYFEKDEINLYKNLFASAEEGIYETKKLIKFFDKTKNIKRTKYKAGELKYKIDMNKR